MDKNALCHVIEKSDVSKDVKSFLFACHPFIYSDMIKIDVSEDGEPVLLAEAYLGVSSFSHLTLCLSFLAAERVGRVCLLGLF